MRDYSLTHLSDAVLLHDLAALAARERITTAEVLAHIAEVDARRLYAPAGFSCMHAYCVGELRLSDDAAYKRIQAARAARQFPALFAAIAEGRLHLAAVCLLAPHLSPENVMELIATATHRRKSEVEALVAERFTPREVSTPRTFVRALPPVTVRPDSQLAPGQVGVLGDLLAPEHVLSKATQEAVEGSPGDSAPKTSREPKPEVETPLQRFLVRLTIDGTTHDKLRRAQALLSHAVPSGDVAQVFDRALDALIGQLEKRKAGAGSGRRTPARPARGKRYIPTHVRREVWERDRGQCTFVSESGRRCEARKFLEYDHVDPVARGGVATSPCVRLRCRAHNQYEAERVFGAEFMRRKREHKREVADQT